MHDTFHKLALAVLLLCGLATAWGGLTGSPDQPLVLHRQFLVTLLGAGLMLAVPVAVLRVPVIVAALLAKAGALAIGTSGAAPFSAHGAEVAGFLALAAAGTVLLREAYVEARWKGVLGWRPEV